MRMIERSLLDRKNPQCVIGEMSRYVITNMSESPG